MGNAISSAILDSWMASHKKRVQKWLDSATEESVLNALTGSIFPGGKGYGALHDVQFIKGAFDAYGSIDPVDKKRYWRETDLRLFLSTRFPGSELESSIPILWRCFQFHAYLPFPLSPGRLDYSAFQRAIGLLAAEGNLRLGDNADCKTMDLEKYPDDSARATKRLRMLFRSLSAHHSPSVEFELTKSSALDLSSTEEDIMDVLALTQPDDPCITPAPIEQLRPHAKRILGSSTPSISSSIPRGDFLSLLRFLLGVQLDKPDWGSQEPYFQTGRILIRPDSDLLQRASDAILRRSGHDEKMDVDWHVFTNVLSVYLPDFLSQFRLIFTSFLSPPFAINQASKTSTPKSIIPVPFAQYLNLFLHPPSAHPRLHVFEEFARQKAHYALQTTQTVYSATPPTLNTTDLVAALNPIKTGTLLLITGEAITGDTRFPQRVTIGACMPTPWDMERQRSFRASPPQKLNRYTPDHMLFQLEPCQEILRPEPNAWIMDLIQVIDADTANGTKGGLRFGAEEGTGLAVDFDTGIATLRNPPRPEKDAHQDQPSQEPPPSNSAYHCISPPTTNGVDAAAARTWESRLRIRKLELYDLGGHATAPFEESLPQKPRLRDPSPPGPDGPQPAATEQPWKPWVGEDELKKRIEGFGPGA